MKGTLPSEIGKLTKLRDLNLANNQFTKQLPSELTLGRLEFLKSLSLKNNRFGGTMPKQMVEMVRLSALHMQGNLFTGEIPALRASLSEW